MNTLAQDIFVQAVELEPAARAAFLAQACGDNAELHLEVQRLLIDAERADSFFGDADGATLGAEEFNDTYAEKEGDVIGPYKLRQQIGEGGFGSVWMAEQSVPISRMVALKVIKAGMDTKQVLARFEAERQALAMMDHPHIAKVLDAGATPTGRPWFAMELVKGIPITDYCDQAGLGTRERLALFRDVCAAINHAHQKGIIHRDIKPSNVMVTLHGDKPVVKVIDFGIAKATQGKLTDQTLFTRFEQFIGTPVYMSPEQASLSGLDIDTRSDIYALGILLYELIVGKPPFDAKSLVSAGYEEMRRIIREVEPVKPSSRLVTLVGEERTLLAKAHRIEEGKLNKLVEPDLDWIVMKAIDKDRTRRYETANAFAQDIVRFLADEAVTARPPSKGYQFKKFARRNQVAFRIAALIVLLLVAATVVSTWQAVRATAAERKTAETLNQVAAERDAKELARKDAEDISKFLGDVFQSPDPTRDGREIKVVELLDNAARKLETGLATQPGQRAKLQATLGSTYSSLGLARQAIPLREKLRDYCLATFGPEDPDTLGAMTNLAVSYNDAGRRDEALKLREEVLPLSRKINGPEHPATLNAMTGLAISYDDVGRRDEALRLRKEVLPLSRKVNGPEHPGTLWAMNNLANSYAEAGRKDEALKLREEVLALSRKVNGPEHPTTLVAMTNLADSYSTAGRRNEALKLEDEVLPLSRKVNGPEHPGTLSAMGNLATSYFGAGRRDEALKMKEELLTLRRKVNGPEHLDTLGAMASLAFFWDAAGRKDEALKLQEEVLTLSCKGLGLEHPDTLRVMGNLAAFYGNAGRRDEALKLQEEVLPLSRKVKGPEHPETLSAMTNLANSWDAAGRRDEALKLRQEVLPLSRKVNGPEHSETLIAMNNLANSYDAAGRKDEALMLLDEVLTLSRKVNGPEHPDTLHAMHNLAVSYGDSGRRDEALKLREEVLALRRKVNGPEHPDTLSALKDIENLNRLAELEEALDQSRKEKGPEHPDTLTAMNNLANSYRNAKLPEKALGMMQELLPLRQKESGPSALETIHAMQFLSFCYYDAGSRDEAFKMGEEVLALRRKVLGPEHPETLASIEWVARLHEEAGRTAEALPLLTESSTKNPANTHTAMLVAALQVWFGKDTEHTATYERMLAWSKDVTNPDDLERSAKLACLRPIAESALREAALGRACKAVELGAELPGMTYYQMTRGMAEYRAGYFAEAVQTLLATHDTTGIVGGTSAFYRAMSLFQQGKKDGARALFTATAATMKALPADEKQPLAGQAIADDLILWLAYKEAKALIENRQ